MSSVVAGSLSVEEARVLEEFAQRLQAEQIPVDEIWLYGSRARGEPRRPDSDVDVLVLVEDGDTWRIRRLLYDAAEATGANPAYFSAQVWDRAWLANRREIESFFLREVERDKIVLYERR